MYDVIDLVMTDDGEVKQVMVRKPAHGQLSIVDWVSITVCESTFSGTAGKTLVPDVDYVQEASRVCERIFGFGVTDHPGGKRNFYRDTWILGQDFGQLLYGGQNNTMMISLNGQGCLHAREGWEQRLYDFLTTQAVRPKITRVDLAHDDYDGRYLTVDWADEQDHAGGFTLSKGSPPTIEHKGAWRRPSGKGRTLAVGLRDSGKYCRIYEKGKKEGDASSLWTRAEVEFKSKDRVIPFEVLLNPSDYFLAAYPCFQTFAAEYNPTRIETIKKQGVIVWEKAIATVKHQFGKYLSVFRQVYGDDKAVLDLVCSDDPDAWPRRLLTISQSLETSRLHSLVFWQPDYGDFHPHLTE